MSGFYILTFLVKKLWPNISQKIFVYQITPSHDVDSVCKYGVVNNYQILRSIGSNLIKGNFNRNLDLIKNNFLTKIN